MSIEKHRAFLESLDGKKGLPEEMCGLRFDAKLSDAWDSKLDSYELSCYFAERARRAESRQIPDLKEKVTALVRDAMDATDRYWHKPRADDDFEMEQFRRLCEPEKGREVKP